MKIALVTGLSEGGIGLHVKDLAAGLEVHQHHAVVVAPQATHDLFDFAGVGADVLSAQISERPNASDDIAAMKVIRAVAKTSDVVHAHGMRAGALATLATLGVKTPVVVTLHNAAPTDGNSARVYAALEGLVVRRADAVLGVSSDLVERMRSLSARKTGLAVVPAPEPAQLRVSKEAVRDELFHTQSAPLLVTVGRLAPQKDQDVLLDAVERLDDLGVSAVIVGEGPLRADLQARIDRDVLRVRLLGRRDDVPELLAAADIVVSTATWEGQPLWLQEALQVGAAIVATDVGGTRETIRDAGIFIPPHDSVALERAIRQLITNPQQRHALARRAKIAGDALPTADDAVRAALSVYRSVARS